MTLSCRRFARLGYFGCLILISITGCSKTDKVADDTDAAASATTGNQTLDSNLEQVQDFKLSMPRMQKWAQANRNMMAVSKARPDLEGSFKLEQNASIDQQVAAMEKHAEVKKALKDAGLSPREYTMVTHAYMAAAAAQSVRQMPAGKQRDSMMQSLKVHPDNVTFVQQNMAELEKLMKSMEED